MDQRAARVSTTNQNNHPGPHASNQQYHRRMCARAWQQRTQPCTHLVQNSILLLANTDSLKVTGSAPALQLQLLLSDCTSNPTPSPLPCYFLAGAAEAAAPPLLLLLATPLAAAPAAACLLASSRSYSRCM